MRSHETGRLTGRDQTVEGWTMKLPRGKVIITASLNGAFVNKDMNPNVPEQPDEIARASRECYDAGAAIVHIHARDEQGKPAGTQGEVRGDPDRRQGGVQGSHRPVLDRRRHQPHHRGARLVSGRRPGDGLAQHGHADAPDGSERRRALLEHDQRHRGLGGQDEGDAHQARDGVLLAEHVPGRAQPHQEGPDRAAVLHQLRARHDAPGRDRGEPRHAVLDVPVPAARTATSTRRPPAPPSCPSRPWA